MAGVKRFMSGSKLCSIVLSFYRSIVLSFYRSIVLSFYRSIVLSFYCSIVLLAAVPLVGLCWLHTRIWCNVRQDVASFHDFPSSAQEKGKLFTKIYLSQIIPVYYTQDID